MKSGHKIGRPVALFTKIEQAQLDDLKKRYGGNQMATNPPTNGSSNAPALNSVTEAERAIAAQGDKVRALKASGTEKAIVQEQVKILLALKKRLAEIQLNASKDEAFVSNGAPTTNPSNNRIADIEKEIVKQAEKVRTLKQSADKSVWQPEVEKLLALKADFVSAGGQPAPASQSSGKSKKKK